MPYNWPVVSVVISTYNRPAMLQRALDSVLHQSYDDFEVVIVHDGPASKDVEKVCFDYQPAFEDRRVPFKFMALEENSGYQCVPKNVGIWHSRGDYIAYLDDDNEWYPQHLIHLVGAMEEGVVWPDFVYCKRLYVFDPGFNGEVRGHKVSEGESSYQPWDAVAMQRLAVSPMYNFIDTSDFMVAKGALWRLQLATGSMWNESMQRFGDWELITRGVYFAGWRGKGIDEVLTKYHWHGGNVQLLRPASEAPTTMDVDEYAKM